MRILVEDRYAAVSLGKADDASKIDGGTDLSFCQSEANARAEANSDPELTPFGGAFSFFRKPKNCDARPPYSPGSLSVG